MDTISAFLRGRINRNNEMRVFDWEKCADIIKANPNKDWYAGLSTDLEWTGGRIWIGELKTPDYESYTHLSSTWAIPVLYDKDGMEFPCYIMDSETEWNYDTRFPDIFKEKLSINQHQSLVEEVENEIFSNILI